MLIPALVVVQLGVIAREEVYLTKKFGEKYVRYKAKVWADRIKNPKSIIDKLGVKKSSRVAIVGIKEKNFLNGLPERTTDLDFVFYSAESLKDLEKLSSFKKNLKKDGAIWVVSRKGKEATIKDSDVMAAAKKAGLVDTKVVSFSPTHTALKLVIPKSMR